jgi:hypothetical protein
MKRFGSALVLIGSLVAAACGGGSFKPPAQPAPPVVAPTSRAWAVVVHDSSGAPLANAAVSLVADGTDWRGSTNADGYLLFDRLPLGVPLRLSIVGGSGLDAFAIDVDALRPDTLDGHYTLTRPAPPWPGKWSFDRGRVTLGGQPADYNAVSRFSLDWEIAHGDDAGVIAKFNEAKAVPGGSKLRVFRVFTTAVLMFDLSPAAGRQALPHLLELARANGVYLEVVANADTSLRDYDVDEHGLVTAKICAASEACALWSYGNELDHDTQKAALHDFADVERKAAAIAREAGLGSRYTAGTPLDDEGNAPTGAIAVRHLTRDRAKMVRHLRDLAALADDLGVGILSDEPMGCDDHGGTHGQRYYDDGTAFSLGLVSAGFGLPWTYHMQAGLSSAMMGPQQRSCAAAMLAGARLIPEGVKPHFENTAATYIGGSHGWAFSPVQRADLEDRGADGNDQPGCGQRVFSFTWGDEGRAVAIGVKCDLRIQWGNGWAPVEELPSLDPTTKVWKIRRGAPAQKSDAFELPFAA